MRRLITYRPDYPSCHESDWSLVNKITRFNRLQFKNVCQLLLKKHRGRLKSRYNYEDPRLDLNLLRQNVGLIGEHFDQELCTSILSDCQHLDFIKNQSLPDHLIFCPECIKHGFHSPYYMTPFMSHCPIHGLPLAESCPSCSKQIPYQLSTTTLAYPYGCPKCGYDLYTYKDQESQIDLTQLELFITYIHNTQTKAVNWNCLFNFDRKIAPSSEGIESLLIGIINNHEYSYGYRYDTWSFVDTDEAKYDYWEDCQKPWELQLNRTQRGFLDCLFFTLIDCFSLYQNTTWFRELKKNRNKTSDLLKTIDTWERVWEQRVSHYREFGRFKLLEPFVSNMILRSNSYSMNAMLLMREFEIILVHALIFQLHQSFLTALHSSKRGFDLRCEIETKIEKTRLHFERNGNEYTFHAFFFNEAEGDELEVAFVSELADSKLRTSDIYLFCQKPSR